MLWQGTPSWARASTPLRVPTAAPAADSNTLARAVWLPRAPDLGRLWVPLCSSQVWGGVLRLRSEAPRDGAGTVCAALGAGGSCYPHLACPTSLGGRRTWPFQPRLLRLIHLHVLLKAEPAGRREGLAPTGSPGLCGLQRERRGAVYLFKASEQRLLGGEGSTQVAGRSFTCPGSRHVPDRSTCCASPCGSGGCSHWDKRRTGVPASARSSGRRGWDLEDKPDSQGKPHPWSGVPMESSIGFSAHL